MKNNIFNFTRAILAILLCLSSYQIRAQTYHDALRPFWFFRNAGAPAAALAFNTTVSHQGLADLIANPAKIGMARNAQASLGLQYGIFNQNTRLGQDNEFINQTDSYTALDGMDIIYPLPVYQGSLALGFTFSQVANYSQLLFTEGFTGFNGGDVNGDIYLKNKIEENGNLNALSMGGAVEFQKDLLLGLSVNYYTGYRDFAYTGTDVDTFNIFHQSNIYYDYHRFERNEVIKPEYNGWNVIFGLLYIFPHFKYGLSIASPLKLKVNEKSYVSWSETYDEALPDTSVNEPAHDLQYNITFPLSANLGVAVSFYDFELSIDMAVKNWHGINFDSKLYDTEIVNGATITLSTDKRINNNIRKELKTSFDFGAGLRFPLLDNLSVLAGQRIISRPYYDLPKTDRYLSLSGLGLTAALTPQFTLNLSYQILRGRRELSYYFNTTNYQKYQDHMLFISSTVFF